MNEAVWCDVARVLELTEAMHEAASESRWNDLVALEAERDPVLYAGAMRQSPETLDTLRSIMLLEKLITDLASAARDETAELLGHTRRVHRAVAAYSSF